MSSLRDSTFETPESRTGRGGESGAHADLLVLDGDPQEDLTVVGDPEVVIEDGAVVAGGF